MSTRIKFVYPPELLHEPIIYQLGKQFGLVTNIRKANIDDTRGWVDMELVGAPMAIEAALAWAKERGLLVALVEQTGSSPVGPAALTV